MSLLGQHQWEVTAVAPPFMYGDLRPILLETVSEEICPIEIVPAYKSKYIHIMTYDWKLRDILQQDWDLIHCWEEPYILVGAQVAYWSQQKTPLIYSTFQNKSKKYPPPFNWIERYSMSRASGWLTGGQTVADTLKDRPGYSLPMRIIPMGVDIQHFYPSVDAREKIHRLLNWSEQKTPIIGYLGRFVPEKGLNLLMKVLDSLSTPWRALFVGGGKMESSLRKWAENYPEQVRIRTNVQHDEVPQYLNAMDILVAPSQTVANWREQFGRMLIEAFACGLPVIGSDSGEIPYVLKDAGIVVGEKDELAWVKTITDLLNSPSQRQELTQKALEKAHTVYAWPIIAQQHLEFFDQFLA